MDGGLFPAQDRAEMQVIPFNKLRGFLIDDKIRTRPKTSTAASLLGKISLNTVLQHWRAITHFIRYAVGTQDFDIISTNKPKRKYGWKYTAIQIGQVTAQSAALELYVYFSWMAVQLDGIPKPGVR